MRSGSPVTSVRVDNGGSRCGVELVSRLDGCAAASAFGELKLGIKDAAVDWDQLNLGKATHLE